MKLFENTIYQKIADTSTTVIVLLSFAFSGIIAPVANAETQEVEIILPLPEMLVKEPMAFPVSGEKEPAETITVGITAYNSLEGQTDSTPCITANGHDLCKQYEEQGFGNTIAANFLPMGTQVRFPELFGNKIFVVRDRMNRRYGYGRVDVWMYEYDDAIKLGFQRIKMEIF